MPRPLLIALAAAVLAAQQADIHIVISDSAQRHLAVPDFRGDANSQPLMAVFNQTLWDDLDDSGAMLLVPKTAYPLAIPQQPSGGSQWMRDWALPPTSATHMAGGYSALQSGTLVVRGWMVDVRLPNSAPVLEKSYGESADQAGARKAAHRFAADILEKFGVPALVDTHIYYVHDSRPAPHRETQIWTMDADGGNARPLTPETGGILMDPAISPDGSKVAFGRVGLNAGIAVYSVGSARALPFANQSGLSAAGAPAFTPDGRQLLFAQSIGGKGMQLFIAGVDGSNQRAITGTLNTDTEPRVNPRNPSQIAFVSGRSKHQQIYLMNLDGTGGERLTDGTSDAANPSWSPDGNFLLYASTDKAGGGDWNVFLRDLTRDSVLDLTHHIGRNEHPVWAPDGRHLVFDSNRTGTYQIWTMLSDGTHLHQLTRQGANSTPVWGR